MGSFYQSKYYMKGGGSFYQPNSFFKGGMKHMKNMKNMKSMNGLKINTHTNSSIYTTRLTKSEINSIQRKIANINTNVSNKEQYEVLDKILNSINEEDFNSNYDKKEIGILKHTIKKMLEGKKGSKPHEFINVLEKILERLTNSTKGGYRRKTSKGGFYPTIMTNLIKSGSILMPLAMRAGYNLFNKTRKNRK